MEQSEDFPESPIDANNKKINFFNLGPQNDFKKILDKDISSEIENKFRSEMKELGYI